MRSAARFTAATLDEALSQACGALRARVGELHYEVVEVEGEPGVAIEAEVDPMAVVGLFLSETFKAGRLDVKVRLHDGGDAIEGELSGDGDDLRILTGGGGKGLDALQYLCNRVINRRTGDHCPVHLDCSGYKERRARQLQERAESAAEEAVRRRGPVVLGPLTPAARREIHLALADDPAVETESDGEGFLKRVVVRPRRRR
jgi:spoIIIJ-associated protein